MVSQIERGTPFSYRMSEGASVIPAAQRAYERVLGWIEKSDNKGDENKVLANFSAAVVESTLFEITKDSDKVLGLEYSEELLTRYSFFCRREGFNDDEIRVSQLIGLQEVLKVLGDTRKFYIGSD